LCNTLNVKTPDDKLNIMLNGWLIYQTICCRIWARTAFYQSGGAIGFRDQLQDCLGMKFIDSSLLQEYILKCAMHQFIEGDVLHWWHEETKKGIRTKFSDDLLWLPYSVYEYVNMTDDYKFLEEEVEYLQGDRLKDEEVEVYNQFFKSEIKESLYLHCIRAIDRACTFGENGFPLIGSGDWNDGFSNIGPKGKGESIWLGFFLYDVLNKFSKICEKMGDSKNSKKYVEIKEKLKHSLNTKGWDGRWFKRAITDDGKVIGSISSPECKIDSISQSWAVISEAGDNDKKYISMQELENNLVDRENNIIKLFYPSFETSEINPGYIKAYPKGIRENGGQYTHECCC
jgi:cellobiose phosphorylase